VGKKYLIGEEVNEEIQRIVKEKEVGQHISRIVEDKNIQKGSLR